MPLSGPLPKEDRTQVRHRNPVHAFTEYERVPFEGAPELPPRASSNDTGAWATAGVIPGVDWPQATMSWWRTISRMPHCTAWEDTDWQFAFLTAEVHARTCEGWKGYNGSELRQRERLMGVYYEARLALRIRYVDPKGAPSDGDELPAGVTRLDDFRSL